MRNGSNRAQFALALRKLSEMPKAVVEALRSTDPPDDRNQFMEFLERHDSGHMMARRMPTIGAVELRTAAEAWDEAERTLEVCDKHGVVALAFGDPDFPKRLTALQIGGTKNDASLGGYCPILYCKGTVLALNSDRAVAIVGTREPTKFGRDKARAFGHGLADEGIVIVSGLARGCDTEAHRGCIDAKGVGVAVMAHGLDRVYPAENSDLADRLIASGGCLVSEYLPGTPPSRRSFGLRDRIQAGLSDFIIVIETPAQDGTMITVNFARKQHRRVGCLSHPERFASSAQVTGNSQLLSNKKDLAMPLRGPQDALRALRNEIGETRNRAPSGRLPF